MGNYETKRNWSAQLTTGYAAAREQRVKDLEVRVRFVALRAKGKSLRSIAEEIGVSRQTLANWQRDHEEEIENARAMELDNPRERGTQTRDFSQVPTAKLIEMELKLSNELTKRFSKPNILTETQVALSRGKHDDAILRGAHLASVVP